MRIAIVSIFNTKSIEKMLIKNGFIITKKNPNFVVSYGGDGTILYSERKYPGIPIISIKTTKVCRQCDNEKDDIENIIEVLKSKKYRIRKEMKIETKIQNKKLVALNDIQIRNKLPIKALRFTLKIDGKDHGEMIGDGIIVSTPFGSSGYYKSAGGRPFKKGLGYCLNNPFIKNGLKKSEILPENSVIELKIVRENAMLAHDNSEEIIIIKPGDSIRIKKSGKYAKFIEN